MQIPRRLNVHEVHVPLEPTTRGRSLGNDRGCISIIGRRLFPGNFPQNTAYRVEADAFVRLASEARVPMQWLVRPPRRPECSATAAEPKLSLISRPAPTAAARSATPLAPSPNRASS